jgi:hypothetical protein
VQEKVPIPYGQKQVVCLGRFKRYLRRAAQRLRGVAGDLVENAFVRAVGLGLIQQRVQRGAHDRRAPKQGKEEKEEEVKVHEHIRRSEHDGDWERRRWI